VAFTTEQTCHLMLVTIGLICRIQSSQAIANYS
jgi:hypothetical protein